MKTQEKPVEEKQLLNIQWVYLHHPSGRLHRINPSQKDVIKQLLDWGWKKSPFKHK